MRRYYKILIVFVTFFAFNSFVYGLDGVTVGDTITVSCKAKLASGNGSLSDSSKATIVNKEPYTSADVNKDVPSAYDSVVTVGYNYTIKFIGAGTVSFKCEGLFNNNYDFYIAPKFEPLKDDKSDCPNGDLQMHKGDFQSCVSKQCTSFASSVVTATKREDRCYYTAVGDGETTVQTDNGEIHIKVGATTTCEGGVRTLKVGQSFSCVSKQCTSFASSIVTGSNSGNSCVVKAVGVGETSMQYDNGISQHIVVKKGNVAPAKAPKSKGNAGMCTEFNVCHVKTDLEHVHDSDFNTLFYKTTDCDGSEEYLTFCLDPGHDQADKCTKGGDPYHTDSVLDLSTDFGKKIYYLYKKYVTEGCSGDACIAKYQSAARFLVVSEESYHRSEGVSHKNAYNAWMGYRGRGGGGSAVSAGYAIFEDVMTNFASVSEKDATGDAVLQQVGAMEKNGGKFKVKYRVTIFGKATGASIDFKFTDLNGNAVGISAKPASPASGTDEAGNTYYDYYFEGPINSGDCSSYKVEAEVKYSNPDDLRNALILKHDENNSSKQRFLIFKTGGHEINLKLDTTLNPGGEGCTTPPEPTCPTPPCPDPPEPQPEECKLDYNLTCGTSLTLNEGNPSGGETDWETCIIGKSDPKGNPYDIEVQSSHRVESMELVETIEDEDEDDGDINSYYNAAQQRQLVGYLIEPDSSKGYEELLDASYCTISCKEKYEFSLPENKNNVKAGTYFAFKNSSYSSPDFHTVVGIKAQRECVSSNTNDTNTSVEIETFEDRVINLRKQQVDFMNAYEYYKALAAELRDDSSKEKYKSQRHASAWEKEVLGHPVESTTFDKEAFKREAGWYETPNNDWYTAGKVRNDFKYSQYVFEPSADDPEATIVLKSEEYEGWTDETFMEAVKLGTTAETFFIDRAKNKNYYKGVYDESGIFELALNIGELAIEKSAPYPYVWKDCHPGEVPKEEGSTETVHSDCATHDLITDVGSYTIKFYKNNDGDEYFMLNELAGSIEDAIPAALEKIQSLSNQINMQGVSMSACTRYLEHDLKPYTFDPQVTFTYDQPVYMAMMNPVLEFISEPEESTEYFYCEEGVSTGADVFGCDSGSDVGSMEFAYLAGGDSGETVNIKYNEVARVGSRSTYSCGGGYCLLRSPTQFLTYPPDGIVTTDESEPQASHIDYDGRVYPVSITTTEGKHHFNIKFENIGQYFETTSLGRMMGANGYLSGLLKDEAECYYDVYKELTPPVPDDGGGGDDKKCVTPPCPPSGEEKKCVNLRKKYCNYGSYSLLTTEELKTCINALLTAEDDCCLQANRAIEEYKKMTTPEPSILTSYKKICPDGVRKCAGYKIVSTGIKNASSTGSTSSTSQYDNALVTPNGDLKFTVRTVSLNNLFPNVAGSNWTDGYAHQMTGDVKANTHGMTINEIIQRIQNDGESIYESEPDYRIVLTPACIKEIQEYNRRKDKENYADSPGGLNDYDMTVKNADNWSGSTYVGSEVSWENSEFYQLITHNPSCSNTDNKLPSSPSTKSNSETKHEGVPKH